MVSKRRVKSHGCGVRILSFVFCGGIFGPRRFGVGGGRRFVFVAAGALPQHNVCLVFIFAPDTRLDNSKLSFLNTVVYRSMDTTTFVHTKII